MVCGTFVHIHLSCMRQIGRKSPRVCRPLVKGSRLFRNRFPCSTLDVHVYVYTTAIYILLCAQFKALLYPVYSGWCPTPTPPHPTPPHPSPPITSFVHSCPPVLQVKQNSLPTYLEINAIPSMNGTMPSLASINRQPSTHPDGPQTEGDWPISAEQGEECNPYVPLGYR